MTINVVRVSDVRMIDGVAHVFLGKEKVLAKTEDRKFKLNGAYDACIPVQGNEDMIDEYVTTLLMVVVNPLKLNCRTRRSLI